MPEMDVAFLTIAELNRLYRQRELSPVEVTKALLARIAAHDGNLYSFLRLTEEVALAEAEAAERELMAGQVRGPLHGIPYALKDIVETAGIPTTGHSKLRQDHVPSEDAELLKRLRAGGGILMGKLATWEFALGGPSFDLPWPPARNPWNPDHLPGGSSSGAGAAVAAGFVPGAIGTDTGGSIRGAASFPTPSRWIIAAPCAAAPRTSRCFCKSSPGTTPRTPAARMCRCRITRRR